MARFITLGSDYAAQTLELQRAFLRLDEKVQAGLMQPVLTAASKIVAAAIRSEAPKESGLLAEAIGTSTTRTYAGGGSTKFFVAAGVRWGFRRNVVTTPRGKLRFDRTSRPESGADSARDPVKYLHLVTRGRKAIHAQNAKILYDSFRNRFLGRQVQAAKPNAFMSSAYENVSGPLSAAMAAQGAAAITAAWSQ